MPRNIKKSNLIKSRRFLKKKHLLLFFIVLLLGLFISYPYLKNSKTNINIPSIPSDSSVKIKNTVIYPDSREFLYTEEDRKTTINYQAPMGTSTESLLNYFSENMTKLGWQQEARTEFEAIFVNSGKRFRVWIIYKEFTPDQPVDYYIDYTY